MSNTNFSSLTLPCLRFKGRTTFYGDTVQEASSGAEFRLNRYTAPRYRYTYEVDLRQVGAHVEFATLHNHFTTHGGRRESFLLTDPIVGGDAVRVRFNEPELEVKREASGVYSCEFSLVTVVTT